MACAFLWAGASCAGADGAGLLFFLSLALGTSTSGARRKWCLFLFWIDSTEPDVVYESSTGGGCPQVSPELSALNIFSVWSILKGSNC